MAVVVTAIAAALYVAILAIKADLAIAYKRRYAVRVRDPDLSTATIVQPILSGDPDLEAALRGNLETVPEARFLWLIDQGDVDADDITSRLQRDHPAHRIERVLTTPPPAGVNPKLFKLEQARAAVTAGTFVVLDDDTRVTRAGLGALLAALDTHMLATGLPCCADGGNVFSRLVSQFVNNNAALTYLPLLHFGPPPTINGMAYAITPAALTSLGGFGPLWNQLADDLAVARRVQDASGTIAQTPVPHFVATTVRDASHYRSLMHRWFLFALLLVRDRPPAWRALIALLHVLPPWLLWTVLATAVLVPGWTSAGIAIGILAVRATTLVVVQRVITGRSRHAPVLSIAAELLQPFHLVDAACRRTIRWRTRRYVVFANDDFRPV